MTAVRNIRAVTAKELYCYFASPVAYVFFIIFLMLMGFFTFMWGNFFGQGEATLSSFFIWHPWLYLFLVPAMAMRLWSEEQQSGTIELLFTLPIKPWHAIVGKYFAGSLFLGLALALTFPMVISINVLGNPDNGIVLTGYFGSFLTAVAFLAIGCLTSALTRNQVISFVIAVVICLLAILCGFPPVTDALLDLEVAWINVNTLVDFVAGFSVVPHFQTMQRGVVDVRDVLYFLSVIVFSLFATGIVLRSKRSI